MTAPLWEPSQEQQAAAQLTGFRTQIEAQHGASLPDTQTLHRWSLEQPEAFWSAVWEFTGVIAETRGSRVLENREAMPGARWFPDARLNFAENLLRRTDDAPALIFRGETGLKSEVSFADLRNRVGHWARALRGLGIEPGDRVAGVLPNLPETLIAMLAATSVGAVWSSCSPDFGVEGVLDRLGQIEPRLLFSVERYAYGGRVHDRREALAAIQQKLPSLERAILVPYLDADPTPPPGWSTLDSFLEGAAPGPPEFLQLPFDHPVTILFSSGTTGVPKCIVHGAGGTLLQHLKEHRLHVDLRQGERFFYFTTCGWMMWNWLASGLASGATLVLYEGSPFHPSGEVLFDLAEECGIEVFGTSAKFIDAVHKAGLEPIRSHDLSKLRTILSTGSPLVPESFDFVYRSIKEDVCLSSISGGTDIVSCFVGGDPTSPVWRGEIQAPGLGMKVEVFDEDGAPLPPGRKGELVCTAPFPSMPVGFWNDPDGSRYAAAYFERFPGVWHHGDYVEWTEHGGMRIQGRSDAVLNPGGVRIGTAEIYRQVEQVDAVLESLAICQTWQDDVRIVLFVVLRSGTHLDEALGSEIRRQVREGASPRHVPAVILQVPDLPRTRSGKLTEIAVRELVHGRPVRNLEALANPEALAAFQGLAELEE